jgi:hypothetical protein
MRVEKCRLIFARIAQGGEGVTWEFRRSDETPYEQPAVLPLLWEVGTIRP